MSEHNALKLGTSLSAWGKAAVGLGDLEEGLSRLGETLMPVVNPWELAEWARLRGERWFTDFVSVAGVAGNNSHVGIINPAGSGNLVVIDQYQISGGLAAAQVMILTVAAESVYAAIAGFLETPVDPIDLREPNSFAGANASMRTFKFTGTNAGIVGRNLRQHVVQAATDGFWEPAGIVLPPGTGCALVVTAVNTAGGVNFLGRERKAFTGEFGGA